GSPSSRSLMRLRWKYVTRRLVEERASVTHEIAAAAVSLFCEHVPGCEIAVPGAAEDLLMTAFRTADPHEVLHVLDDQARQPSARLSATRRGLRLEGKTRGGSRRYLSVSASLDGTDKHLRIPIARITTSADGDTWSAMVDRERFPRPGRWHISLDIEDDWGLRRPALRI